MTGALRIGVVGIGKIARDQHLPAIAASPQFTLVATASRHGGVADVPCFAAIEAMLADGPELDAVSICTPPEGRAAIVHAAIAAGKHVMIEKPPGVTVSEVTALEHAAARAGVTLFATWHSREAAGVGAARAWLADRSVRSASIVWREDIRTWHPGQEWILGPGGFGVFDPGINALSIATEILPGELVVKGGELRVPDGRQSPISASLQLTVGNAPVSVDLDFLQTGAQIWDISVETDRGALRLEQGGSRLLIDGEERTVASPGEYPRLYRRFAELVAARASDVDARPLGLVADAFLASRRVTMEPFEF
jgi:D-galactose 1-dehydrogenase/L-arabinose 1- dehydrogenase